jgi:hypothetical protein
MTICRSRSAATSLLLIVALIFNAISVFAHSARAELTTASAIAGADRILPIGSVESLGALIDGRPVYGRETIWGGELIQATAGMNARVALDAVGQLTLASGSAARIATDASGSENEPQRRLLIVSLVIGAIKGRLSPSAGAYVEAGAKAFRVSDGADFSIALRDGEALALTANGEITADPAQGSFRFSRGRRIERTGACRPDTSNTISTSKLASICVRVTRTAGRSTGSTASPLNPLRLNTLFLPAAGDSSYKPAFFNAAFAPGGAISGTIAEPEPQGDTPAAGIGLVVEFDPALGTLSPCIAPTDYKCPAVSPNRCRVITNSDGVAILPLQAGSKPSTGKLRVTAEDDCESFAEWELRLVAPPFFTPMKMLVIGAAAVGIGVGARIVTDDASIKPIPPPVIVP